MCLLSAAPVMSYAQLESLINKWSSELEDQERHFLQQATQVNAWDRMLVENGEKVAPLACAGGLRFNAAVHSYELKYAKTRRLFFFFLSSPITVFSVVNSQILNEMPKIHTNTLYF